MKRRLLSAFLAVMMVLTMAPVAFAADGDTAATPENVAEINGTGYATLQAAVDAAKAGDTITLLKDITVDGTDKVTSRTVIDKPITLDLNDKTIKSPDNMGANTNNFTALHISADVTINATTGGINTGTNGAYAINVMNGATLTINGGNYYGGGTAVQVQEGTANINGGTFACEPYGDPYGYKFLINCIDSAYKNGTAKVSIKGGSFVNFDPSDSASENPKGNFCVSGYVAVKSGTDDAPVWTVEDHRVAEVGNIGYSTLADAVAAAQSGETVKLLANINGQTVIPADKNIVLDLNGKTMTHTGTTLYNSGTLVVKDSSADKSGKIVSTGNVGIGVNHNSTTTIEYANIQAQEGAVITGYATGATITIEDGIFTALDNAVVAGNGNKTDKNTEGTPERVNANKITINGGTFNGMIKTSGYVACGIYAPWKDNIVVNGGTFNITGGAGIVARGGIVVVNNGEFNTTGNATGKVGDSRVVVPCSALVFDSAAKYPSLTNDSKIQINDGKFKSDVDTIKVVKDDADTNSRVVVGSGYFTTDPSAYCVTGKTGVPSNRTDEYVWTVGKKSETKAEVATGEPTVDTSNVTTNTDADKKLLEDTKTALSSTEVEGNGIATAAAVVANNNTVTADETVVNQLNAKADNIHATTENTNIVIQTYMDMTITGVDASSEKKTITVDIQPMYRTVATTADVKNGDEIVLEGEDSKAVNAVQIGNPQKLVVSGETTVSIQLPNGFVTDETAKIFVQHKGYEYEATVTKDNTGVYTATFTNPHGFSPFTISMTSQAVAQIGETKYTSLQDAVNAVENNGTIKIVGGNKDYTATISGSSKTIKVKNSLTDEIKVTVNGESKTIKPSEDATFTYTKPSSSSSGGSSSGKTTYKVTTSAVNNGGVNASPSNAEKGATITLTLSPDKGYKLDKLTVTDGSGKSVSTVKKSDTVYTFTMPASAVTVGVSYAKADETPSKTTFNDVSANDWFASAVDYVTGKGMMNGTAANTFSPKANTTRGMLMTVLARHAGEDTTGGSVWYEKGMNWAKANGVSDGTNPQVNITREQLAAMLYRYAQNKKYDVSGAKSLDGYTDAQSVSSYAVPALQWANAAGVVNGKSGSKLDPKGYATRAEVAAMLMRFCENVEK